MKMSYRNFVDEMHDVVDMSELSPECQDVLIDLAWDEYSVQGVPIEVAVVYLAELVIDEVSAIRGCK